MIIQRVKDLTDCKEVVRTFYREPNRAGMVVCPFHPDSDPSVKVYDDGYKCFGCQTAGDQVDFVARLTGVSQLKAAQLIAAEFRIPTDQPPTRAENEAARQMIRRRNVAEAYNQLENKAFLNMADFRSRILKLVEHCWPDIPDDILPAVHLLPQIEGLMETLAVGSAEERVILLREGVLHKWARLT